jgi:hypothetical protein
MFRLNAGIITLPLGVLNVIGAGERRPYNLNNTERSLHFMQSIKL